MLVCKAQGVPEVGAGQAKSFSQTQFFAGSRRLGNKFSKRFKVGKHARTHLLSLPLLSFHFAQVSWPRVCVCDSFLVCFL